MASYTRIAFVEIVDSHNEEPLDDKPPEDLDADEILVGKYLLPNQVGKPTDRPTMRWVFQLFEGVGLLIIRSSANVGRRVLGLELVHEWTLRLLGPTFKNPRSAQLNLRNVDATAACHVIDPLLPCFPGCVIREQPRLSTFRPR
jgi:hypothetical protein